MLLLFGLVVLILLAVLAKFYFSAQSRQDAALLDKFGSGGPKLSAGRSRSGRQPAPAVVSQEILQTLIPIRNLDPSVLEHIRPRAESIAAGSLLFERGESAADILYLLAGTVRIELTEGRHYKVEADSTQARFPLSTGRQHGNSAVAETAVKLLRVPGDLLRTGDTDNGTADASEAAVTEIKVPSELRLSGLVHTFCHQLSDKTLELPSFPEVSMRLREAIQKEVGTAEAARIIQLDPALAAKLIQIANSPFYLTSNPAVSCQDAVNRIGLTATREIVTSISMKQVFRSRRPRIRQHVDKLWAWSVNLASLCYVLALKTRCVDPDQALMAGLTCDIGVLPFLVFAESFPEELFEWEEIDAAIPCLRGPVGRRVLEHWGFPGPMAEIPGLCEQWYLDRGESPGLLEVVILARLHAYIGTSRQAEIPPLNSVPAYAKFDDLALSPQRSLSLLKDAEQQVQLLAGLLNTP